MVLTFNPVSVCHWLKGRFFDREDPRAAVLKSTYKDNRFLDEDYKRTLEGYRDTDPYYYGVYCLGEWGVLGQSFFDARQVTQRLWEVSPPRKQGEFLWKEGGFSWVDQPDGPVRIYREPSKVRL